MSHVINILSTLINLLLKELLGLVSTKYYEKHICDIRYPKNIISFHGMYLSLFLM